MQKGFLHTRKIDDSVEAWSPLQSLVQVYALKSRELQGKAEESVLKELDTNI